MGDPAGIGPDIILEGWRFQDKEARLPFFVIGWSEVFERRASELGIKDIVIREIRPNQAAETGSQKELRILPVSAANRPVTAGRPSPDFAPAIIGTIEEAVRLAVAGEASAIVTAPIAKHVLMVAGFTHPGHTEFLGELIFRHGL